MTFNKKNALQRNAKQTELISLQFGKVPPNNVNAEKKVLGFMMLNGKRIDEVKSILTGEEFYKEEHKYIYRAIIEVAERTTPDVVLVAQKLLEKEELDLAGGMFSLTKLEDSVVGGELVDIKPHCLIVKETHLKRKLIANSASVIMQAYEESQDVFSLIKENETLSTEVANEIEGLQVKSNTSIVYNALSSFEDGVQKARQGIVDENAVYTGIKSWDEINGKLFPGLYVVAGRPGMGKGIHMTELICRMAKTYEVGVINGEMTDEQLFNRIACNLKGIDNFLFKKNKKYVTDEEINLLREGMEEAVNLKLHVENARRIDKIKNKIKIWVRQYGVKVVLADFLTLFRVPPEVGKYMGKTEEVDYILQVFTDLCKELKVPIILYVQMNREILGRHGVKEPNLGDLKQSGSIEELAFQVSFLHRPEYYDSSAKQDEMGEDISGLMYQIIAKHRDGKLDKIKLRANLAQSQVKEWDSEPMLPFNEKNVEF